MSWQGHRDVNENNYYGKQYKDSLPKLKQLPYDPAMPLLGKIPKGRTVCGKAVCITFTAAGFTMSKVASSGLSRPRMSG